jgi:hypothetical protein
MTISELHSKKFLFHAVKRIVKGSDFKEDKTVASCAEGDSSARLNWHDAFPGFEIDGIC